MKLPYLTIFFLIFSISILIAGVYIHEQAHQAIFKDYGIDSEIKMFYNWNAVTIPEKACPNDSCRLSEEIVDSFGYNIQPIFVLLMTGIAFVIYLMERKNGFE